MSGSVLFGEMSRIGRLPIILPPQVEVKIEGDEVKVKGPKGELSYKFRPEVKVYLEDRKLIISRLGESKLHRSLHGLTRALLANMVQGVSQGFAKGLEISGVGYRVEKKGGSLVFRLGFTHPVEFSPPPGITLEVEGATRVWVKGVDKQLVGQVAAQIRAISPPDRYKGKGIRYIGEAVRLKPGKAGKAAKKK